MRKGVLYFLTGLFLIMSCVHVNAAKKMTEGEVARFFNFYYSDPQPGKAISALEFYLHQEELMADEIQFEAILHFFATVAHNSAIALDDIKKLKKKYSGSQRKSISRVVDRAVNFSSPRCDSIKNLGFLWSEFFATGKDVSVKKMISALGASQKGPHNSLIAAAERSLNFYIRRHITVYETLKIESISALGLKKERIDGILAKYERIGEGI